MLLCSWGDDDAKVERRAVGLKVIIIMVHANMIEVLYFAILSIKGERLARGN